MTETTIRLFEEVNGVLESNGYDYGPEHFGGQVPSIGDVICGPGVRHGDNPREPSSYGLFEVTGRYFPIQSFAPPSHCLVGLVVVERPASRREAALIGL